MADKSNYIGFWALDPVDGTNGFLRGGQYAIALGLIVDGKVMVGAVACPNLPFDSAQPQGPKGVLFSAVRNQGTTERPLDPASTSIPREIHTSTTSRAVDASFCEGVQEAGHYSHEAQASVARRLNITKPSVRIDSQAKYGCLARGDGDIYLRLSFNPEHKENVWVRNPVSLSCTRTRGPFTDYEGLSFVMQDYAAGSILVEEAGGVVTDAFGQPLDFTQGRASKLSYGIVATSRGINAEVIRAVKEVFGV